MPSAMTTEEYDLRSLLTRSYPPSACMVANGNPTIVHSHDLPWGARCPNPAAKMIVFACPHEHVSELRVCDTHARTLGEAYCGLCRNKGNNNAEWHDFHFAVEIVKVLGD